MKQVIGIWMLLTILFLTGCQEETKQDETASNPSSTEETTAVYRKINPEEAKNMMTEEGILIIDVREQSEFDDGYIPGATLLPVGLIDAGDLSLLPDKDQKILVYCRSGNRSGKAAKKLVEYGYTQVYDFGGIMDWPYEIVK